MKDFLGNELAVGDRIVYRTRTGLVEAVIVEAGVDKVKAQPSKASRSETKYFDARTGEDVDRLKHITKFRHRRHRVTNEEISNEAFYELDREYWRAPYGRKPPRPSDEYEYVPTQFAWYIQERKDFARQVYLATPDYIVKLGPGTIG